MARYGLGVGYQSFFSESFTTDIGILRPNPGKSLLIVTTDQNLRMGDFEIPIGIFSQVLFFGDIPAKNSSEIPNTGISVAR